MKHASSTLIAAMLIAAASLPAAAVECAAGDTISLSLDESVRLALERNPGRRAVLERMHEAMGAAHEARTAFFPQITAHAGYTRLDTAPYLPASVFRRLGGALFAADAFPERIALGRRDNYELSFTVLQPLFAGGKIRNTYDISLLAERSAETELARASRELVFEAKRTYLACLQAEENARFAVEMEQRLDAQLADVEAMEATGLAARSDVLKTKVYHAEARLAVIRASNAVCLAKDRLSALLDLGFETEIILTSRPDSIERSAIDLGTAIRTGLDGRAELRQLAHRMRMTEEEIETSRNGYLPDVSCFADFSYRNPDREYEPDFYASWSMGIMAQMNVFDWGRVVHRTRQARSRLRQIAAAMAETENAIALEITRAHIGCEEAWQEIGVTREAVVSAREHFRVTNERFREGLSTNTDLLDAQTLLTEAETALARAKIAYVVAEADLERATESGAHSTVSAIHTIQ